jgi:hypothetical protein
MRKASTALASLAFALLCLAAPAPAAEAPCEEKPRARCYRIESIEAGLSTTQAGAHPDLTFTFAIEKDPESEEVFGLKESYAATRNVRIELPPGLTGDPNVLGLPQQCPVDALVTWLTGGGCPNGSQVGLTKIIVYGLSRTFTQPVYMMVPPGGDVVARLGFIAGAFPTFVDLRVRSEGDYGLVADIPDASAEAELIRAETTTWGVPADPSHDTQRCTSEEAFLSICAASPPRPPGSRPLPFMTNPTRCGVPLEMKVSASSWVFPEVFDTATVPFPPISGCENLPFGPQLTALPTSRRAASPSGLDVAIRLPGPDGVSVLEPSEARDIRVTLPEGLATNPGSADGLSTCSVEQVGFGRREAAHCPDAAKLASTEFDIPALPRRMKGAIYLREPEPGNPFRIWVVADDLGAHVKLAGQLDVDKQSGQISSVVLDVPQFPVREARLAFFAGSRAPLATPPACGTYLTHSHFTPWSGTPPVQGDSPMTISEGCDTGGFAPKLAAGSTNFAAGQHSPFLFTLTRQDGEQNPAALDIALPAGLAARFAGIPRCTGAAAEAGQCPAASQIGHVRAAVGYGTAPLWVPQAGPGKRPTAVYLGGPYKGAPFSIVAVVPAQAGPFDFGDEVVRSAIYVDPVTAQGTVRSDPLPQIIEGVPIAYRTIHVAIDRPDFVLNPTGCKEKAIEATVTSSVGGTAHPSTRFQAVECAGLPFKPKLSFRLHGGTHRGAHPKLSAVLTPRPGDANIARTVVALPRSEFLDQAHIKTVCTRVQFAADRCPAESVYGHAQAISPLLDQPLEGPVYLRSSDNLLPDLVIALHGEVDVDLVGRIDTVRGGIRSTFETVPDAPVTKFVLTMQGGKKGLLVNSRNLCAAPAFVDVDFDGQNGRSADQRPPLQSSCAHKRRK